jgi:protein-S-isoprenylcysteine O-methyltransferase Ste14
MSASQHGRTALTRGTQGLAWRSTRSLLRAVGVQGLTLFGAAGTFAYWQAWTYLAFVFGTSLFTNVYLLRRDPALLRRRLAMEEVGESQPVQKRFVVLLMVFGLCLFALAGLDRRFAWSVLPRALELCGFALLAAGTALVFLTFRANSFGGSTVTVEAEQRVISSGPYRLVRHPMYTGMLLGTLATPLCLGSYVAEALFLPVCALFVIRLRAEEEFLQGALPGYGAYLQRTPYRLIPRFW